MAAKITHESPGAVGLNTGTLHHTDGHYKYYYIYRFKIGTLLYIEKKWGRIGSSKGSSSVTKYIGNTAGLIKSDKEFNNLIKAKIDKGYKHVVLGKDKIPDPPAERIIGLSRFRDIV